MKSSKAVRMAGAGALAVLMATSLFAQSRERRNDDRGQRETRGESRGGSRDDERVNVSGRVTSFSRERDGYRVNLDRGRDSYWIPESRMRNRGRDLRVGISIILGGTYRGGRVDVDAVNWPDDRGSGRYDELLRGTVERVDRRDGVLLLRESGSGRVIDVDMRDTLRSSRVDLSDLRRGDAVTISGEWLRGGVFVANRIESVSTRRR